jgi:hypothetical protein
MGQSMIERVARALCSYEGLPENTTHGGQPMWVEFTPVARTVIAAMRDPTLEMLDAGFLAKPGKDGLIAPVHVWPAMIDAALAQARRDV